MTHRPPHKPPKGAPEAETRPAQPPSSPPSSEAHLVGPRTVYVSAGLAVLSVSLFLCLCFTPGRTVLCILLLLIAYISGAITFDYLTRERAGPERPTHDSLLKDYAREMAQEDSFVADLVQSLRQDELGDPAPSRRVYNHYRLWADQHGLRLPETPKERILTEMYGVQRSVVAALLERRAEPFAKEVMTRRDAPTRDSQSSEERMESDRAVYELYRKWEAERGLRPLPIWPSGSEIISAVYHATGDPLIVGLLEWELEWVRRYLEHGATLAAEPDFWVFLEREYASYRELCESSGYLPVSFKGEFHKRLQWALRGRPLPVGDRESQVREVFARYVGYHTAAGVLHYLSSLGYPRPSLCPYRQPADEPQLRAARTALKQATYDGYCQLIPVPLRMDSGDRTAFESYLERLGEDVRSEYPWAALQPPRGGGGGFTPKKPWEAERLFDVYGRPLQPPPYSPEEMQKRHEQYIERKMQWERDQWD